MHYSIIFIIEERNKELTPFLDMICRIFSRRGEAYEVVFIANGTELFVKSQLNSSIKHLGEFKVIFFHRKVSQAICLNAALEECSGAEILTFGPFQELTEASYEKLIDSMDHGVDLVVPFRKSRKDPVLYRLHSKLLNTAIRMVIGIRMNDIGCYAKIFRREVLEGMNLYGSMFRYFPALAAQKGYKVKEVACEQAEKTRKTKLYHIRSYLDRMIEILNLFFSTNFSKKPLRFFSFVGSSFMALGVIGLLYVAVQKAIFDIEIGARPLLMIAMISFVGGAQIASFGLLGEIISFVHGRSRKEYIIEKII
jgi:hypothetical protein